jgi:hypothetical protein
MVKVGWLYCFLVTSWLQMWLALRRAFRLQAHVDFHLNDSIGSGFRSNTTTVPGFKRYVVLSLTISEKCAGFFLVISLSLSWNRNNIILFSRDNENIYISKYRIVTFSLGGVGMKQIVLFLFIYCLTASKGFPKLGSLQSKPRKDQVSRISH